MHRTPFDDSGRTFVGGTLTTEGFIPYLRVGALHCPVVLAVTCDALGVHRLVMQSGRPAPKRRRGRLCYALPRGGEVVR